MILGVNWGSGWLVSWVVELLYWNLKVEVKVKNPWAPLWVSFSLPSLSLGVGFVNDDYDDVEDMVKRLYG